MLRICILSLCLASFLNCGSATESFVCKTKKNELDKTWIDINEVCANKVKDQIQKELFASLTYLSMGAHFSRDTINLPGFAKFFFESASEERQHAIKLIDYLTMRGQLTKVNNLIQFPNVGNTSWSSGLDALENALKLETSVTNSIKKLIETCDKAVPSTDYHITDWLTAEYLEEQYKGQRDLAGKISTLSKLLNKERKNKNLAEFIFDKKLLGIDI